MTAELTLLAVASVFQGGVLVFVALLCYWQGKYLARMFEKIEADHSAIFLQGRRVEESTKNPEQMLRAKL